jgi:hypothetical protein
VASSANKMCHIQVTLGSCGHQISSIRTRTCMQKSGSAAAKLYTGPHMLTSNVIRAEGKCSTCSARSDKYLKR